MPDFSGDLVTLSSDQERLRQVAGSHSDFAAQPGLAVALSRSGATDSQIAAVGGFVRGLALTNQVQLARQSGTTLDLSDADRAALAVNGTSFNDVDRQARAAEEAAAQNPGGHKGILGWISQAANKVTTLPGVKQGLHGLDLASDAANTVYREASDLGMIGGGPNAKRFAADAGQRVSDMKAGGYDPNSAVSVLSFASRGKQVFHSLEDERNSYGVDRVRLAQEYLIDPEGFMDPKLSTEELMARDRLRQDPQFGDIVKAVDAKRRSPGRDLTSFLDPSSKAHTITSGSLDAVWSFAYDPTLILGKVRKGAQVLKYGAGNFSDAGRIESLMTGNTQVRRGWTALLDDAKIMRSGDATEKAAAYARIRSRTPDLLPIVDEIHGGGLREGKAINSYEELVEHIKAGTSLIRLRNGMAAREAPLMPGAVSRWAATRARVTGDLSARGAAKVIDLSKDAAKVIPDEVDSVKSSGEDATGLPDAAAVGDAVLQYRSTMRGKIDTLKRRWQLLPEKNNIDLEDGAVGAETVRRFAALYMPAGHANALAGKFLSAPLGERRSIAEAVYDQVVHAAGIPSSVAGKRWIQDQAEFRKQLETSAYDSSGKNLDVIRGSEGETTRRAALYDSQTNQHYRLPSFKELRVVAAKLSIREHVTYSALESDLVDKTLSGVRTGWLVSPASAVRNSIDDNLSAWSQGAKFRDLFKSRAATSAYGADVVAREAKMKALQEIDPQYRKMAGSLRGVWHGAVVSRVKRMESALGRKLIDDRMMARAGEVAEDTQTGELDNLLARADATSGAGGRNADEMASLLQSGYKVLEQRMRVGGYELKGIDGHGGAVQWGRELSKRLSTDLGRKVFEASAGRHIVGEAPTSQGLGAFLHPGGVHRADAADLAEHEARKFAVLDERNARQNLIDYMLSDEFTAGRAKLERFSTLRDGTSVHHPDPALHEGLLHRAAEELADDQITDMKSLLSGPDGTPLNDVIDHLAKDKFPSVDVLSQIPDKLRPSSVVQPHYVADLSAGNVASNVIQAIADKGYHRLVAKPMNWMSTTPIYTMNYSRAYDRIEKFYRDTMPDYRKLTDPPEDLAKRSDQYREGISDRGSGKKALEDWHALQAEELAPYTAQIREAARQHAMDLTSKMVDNPNMRTQLALTSRNLFNFYRAQEDFMRRWSRSLKESPENIRKIQLTVEGGMHSGLVYPDENGELVFAYPGSGLAIQTMAKGLSVFGMDDVNLPVVPNLTTKVNFLNAGLDRPFLPTLSPVAAIPVRVARQFAGDQIALVQGQQILEGEISPQRSWFSQVLPSPVYRAIAAMSNDEQEGQYASAVRNAVLNAYASGKLPTDASPDDVQKFKDQIRVGVRNHLFMRAALALILPGAPGTPDEESDASKTNAVERGTFNSTSLKDEFRAMTNKYGYQRAISIWSETRPDQLIYTVGTTQGSLGTGGYLAPTDEVLGWIKKNPELAEKYSSLAAYFAPDGPGDFSGDAWKTELELGLRQHKTLDDFYRDIAVKNAETLYYKGRDKRDANIAVARAKGDEDLVKTINENFKTWADQIKQANPLLVEKWADTQTRQAKLAQSVTEIDKLTQSPAIKSVDPNGDLARILGAYKSKQAFDQTHTGRSTADQAGKDAADAAYKDYVATLLTRSPYLRPIYSGVFDKVE